MTTEEGVDPAPPAARVSAALPPVFGLHGSVGVFDSSQEEWNEYAERLMHYFVANDIVAEEKRRAILLTVVGPGTFRLLKTLASPKKLEEFMFTELVELAGVHFNPKPSPIVKRFEFNSRCQKEGESVAVFVAELRKIAEHCDYGPVLNDMLRDRLVCGTNATGIQRRLLVEPSLTFEKALEIALAAEAAEKDSKRLTGATPDLQPTVHKVGHVKPPVDTRTKGKPRNSPPASQSECYRCGGEHAAATCRCKEFLCHYCKKKGHLAKVCRKKAKMKAEQANSVTEKDTPEGDQLSEYSAMFQVSSRRNKPYRTTINVNGYPLLMEIDTGASVSVVGEDSFKKITEGRLTVQLQETSTQLQTYTKESITVLGSALVPVEHNGESLTLPLIVTAGNGPPLLGRDWLAALQLDWKSIFSVGSPLSLQQVLEKHSAVFSGGLGELRDMKAKIFIDKAERPRFFPARQVPFAIRERVEEELERLQSLGVIRPVQFADWAAPIVPVMKRDGRVRICGDYKITVNRAAKLEKYPIPRIEELFASLAGGKAFTKLDLSHAYLQIPLDEESCQYVTINTHKGLFEYRRLPFGVASAPSIFQRTMETLLQGISGVCVYIDDILVTGTTEGEHLQNLAQVLQRLESAGMRLKKQKCSFLLPSVTYLGHVISQQGLHTEETKVCAIVDAPEPKNVGELRSFLGMVNYYAKFLPDLATTLAPLYLLLQKFCRWRWRSKQRKAFQQVKDLLRSGRVLTHFNDSLPLVLACDASPYGLGAVLSHRMPNGGEKPVGFASRTLTKAEANYSHLDKEGLAIIFGVKKFHQYLYGRKFEIKTDHKPLTHIFSETRATPTMASGRIQRWALILGGYDYSIQYKEGKSMANADALSRLPLKTSEVEVPRPLELLHLVKYLDSTPLSSSQIRVWTDHDPTLSRVRKWTQEGWPVRTQRDVDLQPYCHRRDELSTEGGCLLWGSRVVMPPKGRKRALSLLHEAHPGIVRMKALARGYVWWPGIDKDIEFCVKECAICQSSRKMPPVAPLHPWVRPEKPWMRVHLDYAGPFEGKMFLLIIDSYSKWLDVHPTSSSTSATTIELLRKSFSYLGLPEVIVSDNAATFTSDEFSEFVKRNGIRHIRSPPYHPASNGLVERVVQTFKEGLKRFKSGTLSTRLSRFLMWYRITPHSTTGSSPSELMWGRRLRSQLDLLLPDAERRSQEAQDRQKQAHDSHSVDRHFGINDTVYARNYGQGLPWLPGCVVGFQGSAMYRVRLSNDSVIVRHVDQMRHRVCADETISLPGDSVPETEVSAGVVEPESFETGQNSSEASVAPERQTVASPVQAPDTGEQTETPSIETDTTVPLPEPLPPELSAGGESGVRRSSRVRHPPERFEDFGMLLNS